MDRADRKWRWLVPIVLATIGLLLVTTARLAQGTDLRPERRTELADLIAAEEQRADEALERVESLLAIRDLHQRLGATVLIVTHDPNVAESCARTVTLRDARIAGDVRR